MWKKGGRGLRGAGPSSMGAQLATGLRPIAEAGTPLGLDLWDRAVAVRSTGAGSEKVARAESARAGFGDGARGAQAQGVVLSRRWCNDMQSI
jgi:hypothetical protein